ncbi:MAG: OmpA family protein [Archangium sp.]
MGTKWMTALAVLSTCAFAQTALPTVGLDRLVLVPGSGPVVGGDAQTLGQFKFRVSLLAHYERNPLMIAFGDAESPTRASVIGHRLQAHAVGAIGLLEWLDVQVQVPVTLLQAGDNLGEFFHSGPSAQGIGSPVLGARFAFLSQRRGQPLDLAAQLGVAFPLGSPTALTGGRLSAMPSVHAGRAFGLFSLTGMVGFALEPTRVLGDHPLGTSMELIATGGFGDRLRLELTSRTVVSLVGAHPSTELLLGGRLLRVGPMDFFALAGPSFGDEPGTPSFRAMVGVGVGNLGASNASVAVSEADDDHDGVLNAVDGCRSVAEDRDGVVDQDGCPEDDDDDGTEDLADLCRSTVGTRENQGCPIDDHDGDLIKDVVDQCANEAGPRDRNGCPPRDQDYDGTDDVIDACIAEAGPAEQQGCPIRDGDGDGVSDAFDNCPLEPGLRENQGCPAKKKQMVIITDDRLVIKDKVYFATGKDVVLARSFGLLDQVAQVIRTHASMTHVNIEGHTDDRGAADANRRLSQRRAEAVRRYLIKKGVAPERMTAEGFGPDRPAALNDTAAGREKNRRVEFKLPSHGAQL